MSPRARPGCAYLAGAPMLVAHRGGSRLAPENTLAAFESAVRDWQADMLELDVRVTRDGHLVVFHDATVDRTTDGSGLVSSFTFAELRRLDAGYHFMNPDGQHSFRGRGVQVPTLDEVIEACPQVRLNVECKEAASARLLVETIGRHQAEARVLVAAEFDSYRADAVGYPGPWGASRHHIFLFWLLHRLPWGGPYTPRVDIFQVPQRWKGLEIVTPSFVREAHRRNIPVQVWTIDDPADMERLLRMGVDGVQTDRPDRLARVLADVVGRPLPPGLRGAPA